jgi:hypothetical protein
MTTPATLQMLNALSAAVSVVCPILGVSIGDQADKSTWSIVFDPSASAAQQQAAQTVITNFSSSGETQFEAALAAGLALTWTVSTALNDTYPIDTATQVRMLAERVSVAVNATFTNGTTSLTWSGITGTSHTMTVAQAAIFVKAIWTYLSALFVARATAAAGGVPSWPTAAVAVIG